MARLYGVGVKLVKKSAAGKRAAGAKSWAEKMNHPPKPEVNTFTRPRGANFPAGKMLISTPELIDWTFRVAAENAEEQREQGALRITPYWRVLQKGGGLNQKFPGGMEARARERKAEGVAVTR